MIVQFSGDVEVDIEEQKRVLLGRLQYYREVVPQRPEFYGDFKVRVVIPRIERALEKIAEDTYGICDACGGKISLERLLAVPAAIFCLECQQGTDKK